MSTDKETEHRKKLERALVDPASIYRDPDMVVGDNTLTISEKKKVLARWEFDMAELAVATEEGMPHDNEDLTRRILLAIRRLDSTEKRENVGPGKHHVSSEAEDTPTH